MTFKLIIKYEADNNRVEIEALELKLLRLNEKSHFNFQKRFFLSHFLIYLFNKINLLVSLLTR